DRIFFDLHSARLTPEVARENIRVEGGLLAAVRVAQNHAGVVRVVLDVNGVKEYTASLLNNPPQLVIDLYANAMSAKPMRTASAEPNNSGDQTVATKSSGNDTASAPTQPATNDTKGTTSSTINGANAAANGTASA